MFVIEKRNEKVKGEQFKDFSWNNLRVRWNRNYVVTKCIRSNIEWVMNVNTLSFILEFCGRENNVVNVSLCSSWKLDFSSGADTWCLQS